MVLILKEDSCIFSCLAAVSKVRLWKVLLAETPQGSLRLLRKVSVTKLLLSDQGDERNTLILIQELCGFLPSPHLPLGLRI